MFLEMFERADPGDGFDAAHSSSDGLFADDFQNADVTILWTCVPPQSSLE